MNNKTSVVTDSLVASDETSVDIIVNKLSDGSECFDVRFVRQGEAISIPMRDEKSALSLYNTISSQIESGRIL